MKVAITMSIESALCASCKGRRWVNDENWTPSDPATWKGERAPADGLIPCGICNHAGWDVELVAEPALPTNERIAQLLEHYADERLDAALEDLLSRFDIPALVYDASVEVLP